MKFIKRAGRWIGYPTFFFTALFFFAYFTFPYDKLRDWLIYEVENPRTGGDRRKAGDFDLEIDSLEPSWFTGVVAEGIRVRTRPKLPTEKPAEMEIDILKAQTSLLSLLTGTVDVDFETEIGPGTVVGSFSQSNDEISVDAEIDNLRLQKIGLIQLATAGLPIRGIANGDIDLTLGKPKESSGSVDIRIAKTIIGAEGAKLKVRGLMGAGIDLDPIDAGNFVLRLEINSSKDEAVIKKLTANGTDVAFAGSGKIKLEPKRRLSGLDLILKTKLKDAYAKKSDRARAVTSLLSVNPMLKRARTPDDALQYKVIGTVGRPSAKPNKDAKGPDLPKGAAPSTKKKKK